MSARRPFGSATAALRGRADGPVRRGAALLPELLDLKGAVHVVHALQSAPARRSPPLDPRNATQHARGRLQAAERVAREPLHAPITGAPLATAEHLARAFERAGIPGSRTTKALARATDAIFTPIETVARQRIATVRGLVGEARQTLGAVIAAGDARAARLEQLDDALAAATAKRIDALIGRALGAVADAFAAELAERVLALPKDRLEVPAAEWSEGFCATAIARCEALVLATFHHEHGRVEMLVESTLGGLPDRGPDA